MKKKMFVFCAWFPNYDDSDFQYGRNAQNGSGSFSEFTDDDILLVVERLDLNESFGVLGCRSIK